MNAPLQNAMTIDVEDYFQVANFASFIKPDTWPSYSCRVEKNTETLLSVFEECNVKATFFTLGWIAERYPNVVRQIQAGGHEIASHGYGHQLVYELGKEKFREDIKKSKEILEDLSGAQVVGYRAPNYTVTERSLWAIDVLLEEGFIYDSSIFPTRHPRYGIPDAPRHRNIIKRKNMSLTEFPPATLPIGKWNIPIAGGGYFRLFSYSFIKWGLKKINSGGNFFVFYLHPWEVDPEQPRFSQASRIHRFRHYVNLHKTKNRLKQLVTDFEFTTLQNLIN